MIFSDLSHIFVIVEVDSNWKCGTYGEDLN
jgi:hypothetical protein